MQISPDPTCDSVNNEHVAIMLECVTVKTYLVLNKLAAIWILVARFEASTMLKNSAHDPLLITNSDRPAGVDTIMSWLMVVSLSRKVTSVELIVGNSRDDPVSPVSPIPNRRNVQSLCIELL